MPIRNFICFLVIGLLFASCHKDSSKPPTPPAPPAGPTMSVNLTYNDPYVTNFELILSEPGGKVLLDTLVSASVAVKATLNTADTLLDVTYIFNQVSNVPTAPTLYINAFKSVNPSRWANLNSALLNLDHSNPTSTNPAKVFFTHVPANTPVGEFLNPWMTNGINHRYQTATYNQANATLAVTYPRQPNAYNSLLLWSVGLYSLYAPTSDNDTIDLSHIDTAIAWTFNKPAGSTIMYGACTFNLFFDSTDLTKAAQFINFGTLNPPPHGDIMLPKVAAQLYELGIAANNSQGDALWYYGYLRSMPTTLPLLDASNISITPSQPDNFTVKYNSQGIATYYTTTWEGSKVYLNVTAPADSTTIHPISFVNNLKSKMLSGVTTNDITAFQVTSLNFPGTSYASFQASNHNGWTIKPGYTYTLYQTNRVK